MEAFSDVKIFNQLFSTYQKKFIRFAYSYVHDMAIAEDFTVDSLVKYWENRQILPPDTNIPAYVLTSIRNKCLNYLQHLQTRQEVAEKIKNYAQWELSSQIASLRACDPEHIFSEEALEIVKNTLDKLPERTRKIFELSRYDGLTYKEIGEKLNITVKGVEFHINKTVKALRIALKDYLYLFFFFNLN